METIIVYVDDADYAQLPLQEALQLPNAHKAHWILVGCAPRITHRVSRFVSNRARENWRTKWAERLFQDYGAFFAAQGVKLTTVLAREPLPQVLKALQAEHGETAQIMDMRRPKMQEATAPVAAPFPVMSKLAGTLTGIGTLWAVLLGETLAA